MMDWSVLDTFKLAIVAPGSPTTEVLIEATVFAVMTFSAKAPAALTATPTAPKPAENAAEVEVAWIEAAFSASTLSAPPLIEVAPETVAATVSAIVFEASATPTATAPPAAPTDAATDAAAAV